MGAGSAGAVAPLGKASGSGRTLLRPARVEAEIVLALALDEAELPVRARVDDPEVPGYLSSECLVHLVRHRRRLGDRRTVGDLARAVLRRCQADLAHSIRGFDPVAAEEIRDEVLGRLAVMLVEPGNDGDFFEVRFALALKRLRIDVCRQVRRRLRGRVELDLDGDPGRQLPEPAGRRLGPEDAACLRQALDALGERERRALVLHRGMGVPVHSKEPGATTVSALLGVSERTVRNLLRRAESKLRGGDP